MKDVITAILGGGQGSRLWPLTRSRAKPAVPVGGKFRLIDIPISNSLHANISRIFVLTQFNSASLHHHITQTYRFDSFNRGFVNILAAEQRVGNRDWYQGTADAVRQNLGRLTYLSPREILILSGDQLYLMNMESFVCHHRDREADLTVAVKAVPREQARGLGIMRIDAEDRIVEFVEKPTDARVLDSLTLPPEKLRRLGFEAVGEEGMLLASMGIYVFRPQVLESLLSTPDDHDFGKEIIPRALTSHRVYAFAYSGYWRDIGTIGSFHQANLELTLPKPPLDLYSPDKPIFTHPRFLPGVKINRCKVEHSILSDGTIITGADIRRSIIGLRSVIRKGAVIEDSVVMGANYFEEEHSCGDGIPLGVGRRCVVKNAILDRNTRIGDGARLINAAGVREAEGDGYLIRDGIIVVPAGEEIPEGAVI